MKLKKDFLYLPKGRIGLQKVKIKQTNIKLPWHPWWQRPFATGESPNRIKKKKKKKTFTLERIEIMLLTNGMYLFDMVWVNPESTLGYTLSTMCFVNLTPSPPKAKINLS